MKTNLKLLMYSYYDVVLFKTICNKLFYKIILKKCIVTEIVFNFFIYLINFID